MTVQTAARSALLTKSDLAGELRISVRQLETWISQGRVPKPLRISVHPRWRRIDIEQWIADGCQPVDQDCQAAATA